MPAISYSLVYITCAAEEEACRLGRELVERRLAACANVAPRIRSFYWWDGKVQDDTEALLLVKTRTALVDRVIAAVKAGHSYAVPAIVAVPLGQGNLDFFRWIDETTAEGVEA